MLAAAGYRTTAVVRLLDGYASHSNYIDESELAKLEGPLLLKGHGVLVTWGPAWTTTVTAGQHPAEVYPGEGQFAAPAARCLNGRKGETLTRKGPWPEEEVTLSAT